MRVSEAVTMSSDSGWNASEFIAVVRCSSDLRGDGVRSWLMSPDCNDDVLYRLTIPVDDLRNISTVLLRTKRDLPYCRIPLI